VLLVVAWVLMPQATQLPHWCTALASILLLWRGYLALYGRALPGRWWLAAVLVLTLASTWLVYGTLFGREAGVALVVLLLALKTLEMRTQRDAFVVFFLGFFAILTQFFQSQSLATAAYMLIGLLGLLTALVHAHMPGSKSGLRGAAITASRMAAFGMPLMLVVFMLFPRVAPLWSVAEEAPRARSGLSATMSVGSMADLALDDSIALRLRFEGPEPASTALYFRGPVLSQFDGRQWLPMERRDRSPRPDNLQVQGTPLRYEVTLEPTANPWLLVLDATPEAPAQTDLQAKPTADLQWLDKANPRDLRRYHAQSYLEFQYGPRKWTPELRIFTLLPGGTNPRTLQWAAQLQADTAATKGDARALSAIVLARLGSGDYRYTLSPGVYSADTADEFWFDRKAGFCEHIASAYVVVMRALGVPARLITGYQGAQRNALDGYWTVRQSDAHAWAEIWQAGIGWIRVDPTAAVSPWRIGDATRLTAPIGPAGQLIGPAGYKMWAKARMAWEAVNNRWNQSVLNYGQSAQMDILKKLGFAAPGWEVLGYLLAGVMSTIALISATWAGLPRRRRDPWHTLLARARQRLTALGIRLPPCTTPRQMAQQAKTRWGDDAEGLQQWLLALEQCRYGKSHEATKVEHLRSTWRTLPWAKYEADARRRPTP
jgi:transglutaminase-like putative cysteine protease